MKSQITNHKSQPKKFEFRILSFELVWKLKIENWKFPPKPRAASGGQAAIIAVLLLMSALLVVTGGFSSLALRQGKIVRAAGFGAKSYFLAEAGVEDVIYRLKTGRALSDTETLAFGDTLARTTVTVDGEVWNVRAEGETKEHARFVAATLSLGEGVEFNYGIETGNGGFFIENNGIVVGNVFSNGEVEGENDNLVRGIVIAAGPDGEVGGIHATSSVYAHTIKDSFIEGDAYYTAIDGGTTVLGTKYPGSPVLATSSMPISDETIGEWEAAAAAGGIISSPCPYKVTGAKTLGPVKINCDLEVSGDADVAIAGPVWVAGNISVKNDAMVRVAGSLSGKSVAIIADNPADRLSASTARIDNNSQFSGAGGEGSYILVVSRNESASAGGGTRAIEIGNQADAGDVLVYAPKGEILLQNNASLREVTAYRAHIKNNAVVTYKTGLAHMLFDAGPSGGYDILEWREVE